MSNDFRGARLKAQTKHRTYSLSSIFAHTTLTPCRCSYLSVAVEVASIVLVHSGNESLLPANLHPK